MAEEAKKESSSFVSKLADIVPTSNPIGQALNLASGAKGLSKYKEETGQKDLEEFTKQAEKEATQIEKIKSTDSRMQSEIDSLGQQYLKAQQLATKLGKQAPLPKLLQGTQYDPKVAQQLASDPSQYAIPEMDPIMAQGLQTVAGTPQQAMIQTAVARDLGSVRAVDTMMKSFEQEQEVRELSYQTKKAEQEAELAKQLSEIERVREEHATVKMDPNRFWSTRTTAQKVGFGIAAVLSGIGAGLQGSQRNMALEVMQNSINADIDAQKQDFVNAKDALSQKESLYAKYYALYKDSTAAYLGAQAAAISQVQLKMQAEAAKSQNQMYQNNAALAAQQLEAEKQKIQGNLANVLRLNQNTGGAKTDGTSNLQIIRESLSGDQQKEAFKENAELMKYKNLENAANSIFKRYESTSFAGRALGVGDSDELQAELSSLLTNAGMGSKEVDKIIGSLTPGAKPSDIAQKKASVLNILKQKAPATPLLDSLNIGVNKPQVNIPGKTSF